MYDIFINKSNIVDYFYVEIGHLEYILTISGKVDDIVYDYSLNRISYLKRYISTDIYKECFRFYKNLNSRRNHLSKRITQMNKVNDLIFVTLTFNNDYINYSESTLHKFVKIFFNQLNCDWVANKDYGEKNGRLHYHGVVNSDYIDLTLWKYGNIDIERVRCSKDDVERIKNYILKFVNHSFKNTTCKYVMYSRKRCKK